MNKPNVISLSETFLNHDISDNEINISNYVLYRADRISRQGGVAIYVSADIASELVISSGWPSRF